MNKISKLGILSFARFQAIILGLIGLLLGVLYSVGGLLVDALVSANLLDPVAMSTSGLSMGTAMAFGALIGMPVILAVIGFGSGIIQAIVFNLFAKRFGGVRLNISSEA